MKKVLVLLLILTMLLQLMTGCKTAFENVNTPPDLSYLSGQESNPDAHTDLKKLENGFEERSYRIGEITPVDIPNLLMAEKRYYSPNKENFIKLIAVYDPEDHWTLYVTPIIKVFFGEQLLLEDTMLLTVEELCESFGEEIVWINSESVLLLGKCIFNIHTLKTEKIEFLDIAKLKNYSSIQILRSNEDFYGQSDNEDADISVRDYAVSPDKKYVLYRCVDRCFDWSDVDGSYEKEFFALYNIEEKSFQILYEQTILILPDLLPPDEYCPLWKDKDTIIVNKADSQIWGSKKIDINTGKATSVSDAIIRKMTSDGEYWINEYWDPKTEKMTMALCADDGSEQKLYEAGKWDDLYCFIDNRYLRVRNPDDDETIDGSSYSYTKRLYDLENMVYYKIKLWEPIWEKYGKNTKLELYDYVVEGNKVLVTFSEFPLYESYYENMKRNSVQYEIELLPESKEIDTILKDGNVSNWAYNDVFSAIGEELVPETLQSNFTSPITRAEFCALVIRRVEKENIGRLGRTETIDRMKFSDTDDINVEKAGGLGIVKGIGNNKFDPDGLLTREQAAIVVINLLNIYQISVPEMLPEFNDNDEISSWAKTAVGQVFDTGIMCGVGNNKFAPKQIYTREQAIVTIYRIRDYIFAKRANTYTPDEIRAYIIKKFEHFESAAYEIERAVEMGAYGISVSNKDDRCYFTFGRFGEEKVYDENLTIAVKAFEENVNKFIFSIRCSISSKGIKVYFDCDSIEGEKFDFFATLSYSKEEYSMFWGIKENWQYGWHFSGGI